MENFDIFPNFLKNNFEELYFFGTLILVTPLVYVAFKIVASGIDFMIAISTETNQGETLKNSQMNETASELNNAINGGLGALARVRKKKVIFQKFDFPRFLEIFHIQNFQFDLFCEFY